MQALKLLLGPSVFSAIVRCPVDLSGGALKTGYVFGYEARTRQILIPSDLWIEFSHLGYWQNSLYRQLSPAIEVTALQRGVGHGTMAGIEKA